MSVVLLLEVGHGRHQESPDILYVQPVASRETPGARARWVDQYWVVVVGYAEYVV